MSLLSSASNAGLSLLSAPGRTATAVLETGAAVERRARATLTDAAERGLLASVDAIVTRLLERDFTEQMIERIEASGLTQRIADRMLEDGIAEQIAQRVLNGPELERILTVAFQSSLPEELITQLLENEAVWILVDEIARSPSVTEAISHQGSGFVEQVTEGARDRSRDADARVQRFARRLRRRRSGTDLEPSEVPRGEVP
ncbi:MAG: hypothetical protein ACLQBB_09400 [Solirubrobacteraceae bacterium]